MASSGPACSGEPPIPRALLLLFRTRLAGADKRPFSLHSSGDLGCQSRSLFRIWGSHELIAAHSVSEAYMIGEVEVENLKAIMDVSIRNGDRPQPRALGASGSKRTQYLRFLTLSILPALARQPINDVRDPLPIQPGRSRILGAPECLLRPDPFPRPPQRNRELRPVKRALQGTRIAPPPPRFLLPDAYLHTRTRLAEQAFLSREMMYSTALWGDEEGGVRGDLTHGPTPNDLESAQQRKIHHVLKTARVKPGDRLLEFGTGWGGLAIEVRALR